MSDDLPILPPGSLVDGRYGVEALLGRGGMAAVYRVRHAQLDTLHALKVLTLGARSVKRRLNLPTMRSNFMTSSNVIGRRSWAWSHGVVAKARANGRRMAARGQHRGARAARGLG